VLVSGICSCDLKPGVIPIEGVVVRFSTLFYFVLSTDGYQEIDQTHFDDPNLDRDHLAFDDESPYPEVRSAVANTDDTTMPVSTIRSWVIGVIWAILIPGLNQFFFFRYPSVVITGIVAQLLSFPLGRAAAAWIPNWSIFGCQLNPGPFSVKEHVLVTVNTLILC
jgi:hypothetical protein